jgi:CRISPR-associated protein Cas5
MANYLSLLLVPPYFTAKSVLELEALAPLSMVAKMPGKYYRSQPKPTDHMLWGLLENALGWHIGDAERRQLFAKLKKQHKLKDVAGSGVGYQSLLQWHVRFGLVVVPPLMHYDDLWTQHLKGKNFPGGSRNYDAQAIPVMNAERGKRIKYSDAGSAKKGAALLHEFEEGDEIHIGVLRPHFPQYYSSPTPREYVEPTGSYQIMVETSPALLAALQAATADPAAPLYLGSNDGWVEASWKTI